MQIYITSYTSLIAYQIDSSEIFNQIILFFVSQFITNPKHFKMSEQEPNYEFNSICNSCDQSDHLNFIRNVANLYLDEDII